MKTLTTILIIPVALAIGGVSGYLFHPDKADASLVLSVKDSVTEEYLAAPDTFSRIKNTRNSLDALSTRIEIGITDALSIYDRLPKTTESEIRKAQQLLERAIHASDAAMQEFEGTQQQPVIARAFLCVLQRAGRFDRWVEVYTETLYRFPTHRALCGLANEGIKIGKAAGQLQRVLDALGYVSACPAEFPGRTEVQAALNSAFASVDADGPSQTCETDHSPFL